MFRVENGFAAEAHQMREAVADVAEVLLKRDAERGGHMEVVGLADETDRRRAGVDHGGKYVVVGRRASGALGHAEGGHAGVAELWRRLEEGAVGGIGAGPAALDVVEAEGVERLGDAGLVLGGEVHALGLLAVAERGVVEGEALAGHLNASLSASSRISASTSLGSPTKDA